MSTENMTDQAQTATPPTDAASANASPGAQDPTLKNGWGTDAAAAPAEKAAPPQDAAAQVAAAQVDGSTPAPPTENRVQLHRRVQSRIAELEEARDQLVGKDGNKARASAIETELQAARNAMSGGWDHVGPLEASHLSQWLTNTGNLIVPKPPTDSPS